MGCLILGLEYMHSQSVIHRDMKPENIIMEENGYLRITDFGISKIWKEDNSSDTSGTPGYMAPEVMCRQNHTYAVDYFALGVIGYEFMLGRRPYVGKTRKEIRDMMFAT
jgi:serine/threonine protein kinase